MMAKQKNGKALNQRMIQFFFDAVEENLNEVKAKEVIVDEEGFKWEKIKVKLDNGAVEWVLTPETGQHFDLVDNHMSKKWNPVLCSQWYRHQDFRLEEFERLLQRVGATGSNHAGV